MHTKVYYVCIYTYVSIIMFLYMYACIRIYIYIYTDVYICILCIIYIYIYNTYTHVGELMEVLYRPHVAPSKDMFRPWLNLGWGGLLSKAFAALLEA